MASSLMDISINADPFFFSKRLRHPRGDFFEDWTGAPDSDGPDGWATPPSPLFSRLSLLSLLPETLRILVFHPTNPASLASVPA